MGQGQADVALATLRECSRNGDWLCLKNLHLVTAWLPLLEKVGTLCVVHSTQQVLTSVGLRGFVFSTGLCVLGW